MTVTTERRVWRGLLLRLGGSAAILTLLFILLPFDELRRTFGSIRFAPWLAALGAYLVLHAIGVVKWRLLVNAAGAQLPLLHAIRCYYLGLFGNTFLPSVVGGDLLRAGAALKATRSPEGLVLGSMVDRVQDVLGLACVAALGALLLPSALDESSRRVFWILGAAGIAGVGTVLLALRLLRGRVLPRKLRRRIARVRTAYRALAGRPRALVGAFLLGMMLQVMQVALNAWLAAMIGLHAPFLVWLFVWPLAKIAATLPLTQGGLGVREAALAALFAPFGVAAVAAVAASLLFQVVVISGGLLGGALFVLLGRVQHAEPQPVDGVRTGVLSTRAS